MSCTHEGLETSSSIGGRSKGNKADKTRRSWSPREDETLLATLKELVAQRWKSDNGYRAGYLNKLEDAMKREFPGMDLKGTPHINSKLCTWKKNYYSLTQILSRSGVGFNLKGTFMIDCDDDQWDQILKSDSNARTMRYKPWHFLDDWKEIFGKDSATGENAEDIFDDFNNLTREDNMAEDGIAGEHHVTLDDIPETEHGENSSVGQQAEQVRKSSSKKRKSGDGLDTVCALLGEINRNTATRLDNLCSRIGYEHDLGKARKKVFELLGNIPGLSLDDKFDVCEILADKVSSLEIFMGLPEETRPQYVYRLLKTK